MAQYAPTDEPYPEMQEIPLRFKQAHLVLVAYRERVEDSTDLLEENVRLPDDERAKAPPNNQGEGERAYFVVFLERPLVNPITEPSEALRSQIWVLLLKFPPPIPCLLSIVSLVLCHLALFLRFSGI